MSRTSQRLLWAVSLLVLVLVSEPRMFASPSGKPTPAGGKTECKSLAIRLAASQPPFEMVGKILASRIEERSGIKPAFSTATGSCSVELGASGRNRQGRISH